MKEQWFKIGVLVLFVVLIYTVATNLSNNRDAKILMFCTKEYDTLSPNVFFGYPDECLNKMKELVK